MSGRSAYVRKKITDTKANEKGTGRGRATSSGSQDRHDIPPISSHAMPDFPMPTGPMGTGVGTTNARFLKFSEPMSPPMDPVHGYHGTQGSPSIQSGGSGGTGDMRRDTMGLGQSHMPLDEYAYARVKKPTIRTEDVSAIERSGLRTILDRRTDDVRKGLAKTFTFKKKTKDETRSIVDRPQSSATVRPEAYMQSQPNEHLYPNYEPTAAIRMQQQHFQEQLQQQHEMMMQQQMQQQKPRYGQGPGTPSEIWDVSVMAPPPPTSKLPPLPTGPNAPPIKRWIGAGRPVARWNKLRKDPELWDPNGDVLIFLGHKGQNPRPPPSFRLSSHIIEATESRYLITLLREGSTEEDINLPPSPAGGPPPLLHDLRGAGLNRPYGHSRTGQPTPPTSEDASLADADGQISYEMYFPTPSGLSKTDHLRHQLTTRNVFALLYHSSLVGLSLYQALADLHTRLDGYMPPESDNVGQIINYLSARGIDDVRSEPETAVSLLAWSEGSEVRWEEGWREFFIHCAGMYSEIEQCSDFKFTTPITRALLERACLETHLRVQTAEERLIDFSYGDMWPVSTPGPARDAAKRFQEMLREHYGSIYGSWPPTTSHHSESGSPSEVSDQGEEVWLTRLIATSLQKDFGALYDYLVNRDIIWDESEARSERKWMMLSESGNMAFEADTHDLPITDMLIEFDNKLRFPHIPRPFPIVPESVPPVSSPKESSMFKSKKSAESKSAGAGGRVGAIERRVHLAYSESTNIYVLGSDFTQSDLIDAFVKFEKGDKIGEVDPAVARRGRWVLIYGVLQTLASVSVDSPSVRFRDGVAYHISPRLRGTKIPPWKGGSSSGAALMEASHELSHCWTAPRSWASGPGGSSGEGSSEPSQGEFSPVMGSLALGIRSASVSSAGRSSAMGYPAAPVPRPVRSYNNVMQYGSTTPSVISENEEQVMTSRGSQRSQLRMRSSREQMNKLRGLPGPSLDGSPEEMTFPVRRRDPNQGMGGIAASASLRGMIGTTPSPSARTSMGGARLASPAPLRSGSSRPLDVGIYEHPPMDHEIRDFDVDGFGRE